MTRETAAVVIGASGGIGAALIGALETSGRYDRVIGFSRSRGPVRIDLAEEGTIAAMAATLEHVSLRRVVVATGILSDAGMMPEKRLADLDAGHLARQFAVNAAGPALVMKHVLPRLPRDEAALFAVLSARVGSIGDNHLGGWHAYRASKAALNQLLRAASVEFRRTHPKGICVALHPGTVATPLSAPFAKSGLDVRPPEVAAGELVAVMDRLTPADSGSFFDHRGIPIPW